MTTRTTRTADPTDRPLGRTEAPPANPILLVDGVIHSSLRAWADGNGPPTLYVDGDAVDPNATISLPAGHLAHALMLYHRAGLEAVAVATAEARMKAVTVAAYTVALARR